MLLDENVKVVITNKNIFRYRKLGYDVFVGDTIYLPMNVVKKSDNTAYVFIKCDRCGKELYVTYSTYTTFGDKHFCRACRIKNTNLERYGCENVFQYKPYREKQKQTCIERYGCENVFQNEDVKKKIKCSMFEKYGADHPMHVKEIADRVHKHVNETMSKNGTQVCSSQQRYIWKLYGGKLNYLYEKVWLDIYFEEQKIYVEYNGSGHDIDVKYHKISKEEFDLREIRRYKMLESRGLKEIEIISTNDVLPKDEILLSIKNLAFCILNLNMSNYIVFDIDNNTIRYKNNNIYYDYNSPITYNKISL